jgi:allantoinase
MLILLAREFKVRIHIVHLSSELSVPLIRRAKKEGLRITAETCPHYLFFASRSIQNGRTEFKCAPPIRDSRNNARLWTALGNNTIDFVVSDHSPSPPAMKCTDTGNFFQAWGGISSLQLGLPVMWKKLSGRKYSIQHLVRWMSSGPARLAGLEKQKGAIAPGFDADIVIWNPERVFTLRPKMMFHRHKLTPYLHESLRGEVEAAFLGGEMIYDGSRFLGAPRGALLRRGKR